jgi:hypothetical protein
MEADIPSKRDSSRDAAGGCFDVYCWGDSVGVLPRLPNIIEQVLFDRPTKFLGPPVRSARRDTPIRETSHGEIRSQGELGPFQETSC